MKLATFVYSLSMILGDMVEFVLVMAMALLMFASMFYIINSTGHGNQVSPIPRPLTPTLLHTPALGNPSSPKTKPLTLPFILTQTLA